MINSVHNSSIVDVSLHSATNQSALEGMFNKRSVKSDAGNSTPGAVKSHDAVSENLNAHNSGASGKSVISNPSESNVLQFAGKPQRSESEELVLLGQKSKEADNSLSVSYGENSSSSVISFDSIAAQIGASGGNVSKEQLLAYLQSLMSESSGSYAGSREVTFVRNLLAKFDTVSGGEDTISSLNGVDVGTGPLPGSKDGTASTFELRV